MNVCEGGHAREEGEKKQKNNNNQKIVFGHFPMLTPNLNLNECHVTWSIIIIIISQLQSLLEVSYISCLQFSAMGV